LLSFEEEEISQQFRVKSVHHFSDNPVEKKSAEHVEKLKDRTSAEGESSLNVTGPKEPGNSEVSLPERIKESLTKIDTEKKTHSGERDRARRPKFRIKQGTEEEPIVDQHSEQKDAPPDENRDTVTLEKILPNNTEDKFKSLREEQEKLKKEILKMKEKKRFDNSSDEETTQKISYLAERQAKYKSNKQKRVEFGNEILTEENQPLQDPELGLSTKKRVRKNESAILDKMDSFRKKLISTKYETSGAVQHNHNANNNNNNNNNQTKIIQRNIADTGMEKTLEPAEDSEEPVEDPEGKEKDISHDDPSWLAHSLQFKTEHKLRNIWEEKEGEDTYTIVDPRTFTKVVQKKQ
jgi:hypothetical protein